MFRFLLGVLVGVALTIAVLEVAGVEVFKIVGDENPGIEKTMDKLDEGVDDIKDRTGRAVREFKKK